MWPFTTRRERQLQEELDAVTADRERIRGERNQFAKDRDTYKAAAKTAARQYLEADEKYIDVSIVNELLTTDLTKARERLAEFSGRRTVAEVLEEHDVHRKALADALGEQKRHLNWEQLIGEASRLAGLAADWMADCAKEKATNARLSGRIDELTGRLDARPVFEESSALKARIRHLEKQLDDAVGLPPGGILNSAPWQPGYQDPKPDKQVAS